MPAEEPVTTPVPAPTVAQLPLVLQVPPTDGSLSVVVEPIHTAGVPEIGAGNGLTVTTRVLEQPAPKE